MKNANRFFLPVAALLLVAAISAGVTKAYFSDIENSTGNTINAGTLDLTVDGKNPLTTAKFNLSNFHPGSTAHGRYALRNIGSVDGNVDLENISVSSKENGCEEPESDFGLDTSCGNPGDGEGELQKHVSMNLFWDNNCNGWLDTGENVIYSGLVKDIASSYNTNKPLPGGARRCLGYQFTWNPVQPDNNEAQGDSLEMSLLLSLEQFVD